MAQRNSDIPEDISSHNSDESGYGEGVKKLRVPDAAKALGISPEAVRNRLSRGKLRSVKEGSTVYVLIDPDITEDRSADRSGSNEDISAATETLLAAKDETIRTLSEQLEAERESARRKDAILLTMAQRIPELEAASETSSEASEGSQTVPEEPYSTHAPPTPQTPVSSPVGEPQRKRSWWREFLGME
jgi:DNA-binding Lrp family transcriptional regulator